MTPALARVTTDGSCITGAKGERCAGGWAAIVEVGSDGFVRRGRHPATSSTQMELRAAIEGLRALPDHVVGCELVFDCTTILSVEDRRMHWPDQGNGRDAPLRLELAAELARRKVTMKLLERGEVDHVHRRAHLIAGAQAKAQARGDMGEVPLPRRKPPKPPTGHGNAFRRRVHMLQCTPSSCAPACPVGGWR